jgi:fructokinase
MNECLNDAKTIAMPASTAVNPIVCFGEILWDVFPKRSLPGGAPLNVAYHLHKLGGHPALISRFGMDEEGKKLINLVDGYGIGTDFFQLDPEWPTGKVIASVQEDYEVLYDFLHPVAWDNIQWEEGYEKIVSKASYFVFGSLVTRSPVSRKTLYRLIEAAHCRVLDANLRPPHFSREVIEKLFVGLHLLKLNRAELELITGWFSAYQSVTERMQALQDKFHIPYIVVTDGRQGAVLNAEGALYRHPGFGVRLVDTVGSGDAFLAALLTQLSAGEPPGDALRFANAAGALVASKKGACPDYHTEEIDDLINGPP